MYTVSRKNVVTLFSTIGELSKLCVKIRPDS